MADELILYTVSCRREPFYAIVEPATGRVWTAPTKDGAIRQARDAGHTQFTERNTTRDSFLRSLGIADDPPRQEREPEPRRQAEPKPAPSGPAAWFVGGAGGADNDAASADFSYPRAFRSGKNSLKIPKGTSPFAPEPIAPPANTLEMAPAEEDILIVPSGQREISKATPFTDVTPSESPFGNNEI